MPVLEEAEAEDGDEQQLLRVAQGEGEHGGEPLPPRAARVLRRRARGWRRRALPLQPDA
jgi:hypothetical protein